MSGSEKSDISCYGLRGKTRLTLMPHHQYAIDGTIEHSLIDFGRMSIQASKSIIRLPNPNNPVINDNAAAITSERPDNAMSEDGFPIFIRSRFRTCLVKLQQGNFYRWATFFSS